MWGLHLGLHGVAESASGRDNDHAVLDDESERVVGEPHTLLVVEDDADIREILSELLRGRGYRVLTAANGCEALAVLDEADDVSVILLDLMMPCMDGWQFRDAQRADASIAAIPVIVMTASMHADGMPADTVLLSKPVRLEDIVSHVHRLCGG